VPYLGSVTQIMALGLKPFPELNGRFAGLLATPYLHFLLGGRLQKSARLQPGLGREGPAGYSILSDSSRRPLKWVMSSVYSFSERN